MNAFDRKVLLILVVLGLLLGGVVFFGSLAGLPAPELLSGTAEAGFARIGSLGPVSLEFGEAMQRESAEAHLSLVQFPEGDAVEGRFTWAGEDTVSFWPARPLAAAQRYILRVASGARSQSGQVLRRDYQWDLEIRPSEVLYLSTTQSPELWRVPDGSVDPIRLTSTGGKVFDYGVSADGKRIAYSARNDEGGIDLWEVGREGGTPRLLLPCQADWCVNPAYAPDGMRLVYSRRRANVTPGGPPGVPRLWILDFASQTTETLYIDPNIGGFDPSWSPDGRYLTFFDGLSLGMRVLNVAAKTDFLLKSEMGLAGSWSPDGKRIFYNNFEISGDQPAVSVYDVNVLTQQVRKVLGEELPPIDYSVPAWAPDGEWVMVALRDLSGVPGKQLWLMKVGLDGRTSDRQAVTEDPLFNHAGYHWSPAGDKVVFQRLELGSSLNHPEVLVWDQASGKMTSIAADAFNPQWLP